MKKKAHMWCVASRRGGKALLMLALTVLIFAAAGTTMALLTTGPAAVTNTFDAGAVACRVNNDYTVTNTEGVRSNPGTITDAYIRAAVVVNWTKDDGATVYGTPPTVTFTVGEDWMKIGDYYYYTAKVSAGSTTTALVKGLTCADTAPDGYALTVQMIAEAIQAEGVNGTKTAAEEAWGLAAGTLG